MKNTDDGFDLVSEESLFNSRLSEHIANLEMINYQLGDLKRIKEALEKKILTNIGLVKYEGSKITSVAHDGAQTLIIDRYKLVIKTNKLYKIDKKDYESLVSNIPNSLNPVRKSFKYVIDRGKMEEIEQSGSKEEKELVASFVGFDYSKPSIIITSNS